MAWSQSQGGAETTVVTAFYSLILITSALRAVWFLIPKSYLEPSYTPSATMAFDAVNSPGWLGVFMSEMLVSVGSLCLFSIFILILVYWADILKKYFYPGARRTKPMITFLTLVSLLALSIVVNAILFLCGLYSSEGMLLVNALLLAAVSIVCVCEITIFSNKFRTVLMTLGAINQVSTESQVKRIMWITVTGNLFFATRALLEIVFGTTLLVYWYRHGSVDEVVTHTTWDIYIWVKHLSEVAILCLMLYILQSRFTTATTAQPTQLRNRHNKARINDQTINPCPMQMKTIMTMTRLWRSDQKKTFYSSRHTTIPHNLEPINTIVSFSLRVHTRKLEFHFCLTKFH